MIRFLPDFAQAYHGRGLALYHEDQVDLAVEDFNKAIEIKPDFADAYRNRGVILLNRGDVLQGIADLQMALRLYDEAGDSRQAEDVRKLLGDTGP